MKGFRPQEIVNYLNQHVVGQEKAKKAIAIAIVNKLRRQKLDDEWKKEVKPFNILMIGPTGVGKTELARRIAKLYDKPFCKVDITAFSTTGYVGRSVDEIIAVDLFSSAKQLAKEVLKKELIQDDEYLEKIANHGASSYIKLKKAFDYTDDAAFFGMDEDSANLSIEKEKVAKLLVRYFKNPNDNFTEEEKQILESEVTIEVYQEIQDPILKLTMQTAGKEAVMPTTTIIKLKDYIPTMIEQDLTVGPNSFKLKQKTLELIQEGIVFIDEIDKIAGKDLRNVAGAGVQRELLALVEGKTVQTPYGPVDTDNILFIAGGAFHVAKPNDLMPELRGRFPVVVTLEELKEEDLYRILTEPKYSIIKQLTKLMETDGVKIEWTDEALRYIAKKAYQLNKEENTGARKLIFLVNLVLEDVMFDAEPGQTFKITKAYAERKIREKVKEVKKALEYTGETSKNTIGFLA